MSLTESMINELLSETKLLPLDYVEKLRLKERKDSAHSEASCYIDGVKGHHYRINIRKSNINPLDFSIILVYEDRRSHTDYILTRYNGDHGSHKNVIEKDLIEGCHIHTATERYQSAGLRIDSYAVKTKDYSSYNTALDSFIKDLNFRMSGQGRVDDDYGGVVNE